MKTFVSTIILQFTAALYIFTQLQDQKMGIAIGSSGFAKTIGTGANLSNAQFQLLIAHMVEKAAPYYTEVYNRVILINIAVNMLTLLAICIVFKAHKKKKSGRTAEDGPRSTLSA